MLSIKMFNMKMQWLSNKRHGADALAPEADEGRGKLRKAAGSCIQA